MTVHELLTRELFRLQDTSVTLAALLTALLIVLVGRLVSSGVQGAVARAMRRRPSVRDGNLHAVRRLVHYAVMLVALSVALETVGLSLTALFAAGAIFAIGLGFAMQNIAQNFVSGLILLFERTIKPGDVLEVEQTVVRVEALGMRATLVRTRHDEEMIVPNSVLVQSTIKNFTLRDSLYRLRAAVGVAYDSDLHQVRTILERTAEAFPGRLADRPPVVLLLGFGDSSVNFDVSVWTDDPWRSGPLLSQLNEAIWWALADAGIRIPFPQRDVHLDPALLARLGGAAAG
ncbi:MAG TPA: mechanosensitive ion channel domain-containing protein [Gemmatimonadaceae bacterium]